MLGKLFGKIKNLEYSDICNIRVREERLAICKPCKYKRDDFTYLFFFKKIGVSQCGVCKCSLKDKVLFEAESCPKKKW